ncbi:Upstream stimulatory factor 1 [Schistosoma japonicum]|nr:Upstream stimulatory factor 1 [Schistosoma japonicum]KAH8857101.1 Upstream stimulatory factor 1 [Schistosoma japonicum]
MKISRQSPPSSDSVTVVNTPETNAMNVLPRLLRTMTNRNSQLTNGNRSSVENSQTPSGELSFAVSVSGPAVIDSDSSSSSSSFISTPSSGSSLISFLSPGHLGPVAAMAAVALSTAVTTMSVNDIQESSGLVTLATASSLIEKEWRARTAVINSENVNSAKEHAENTLAVQHHTDLLASAIQANVDRTQQFASDSSPPILIGALNTPSSQPILNESTPVTRAVLNVQSLAAFIRETQKQRSVSSPTTSMDLPLTSVFPVPTETKLTSSCTTVRQVASPSYLLPTSTPSFLSMTPTPQNLPTALEQPLHPESVNPNIDSSPIQSTAFISLQPAPGSLISPSDLQQLVASGEFMSSAARQTLLGQSSDGSTRQFYLLVPSDCPVIMPRVSNNQPTMTSILPSASPLIESISTSAPILEAISPGVDSEENCVQMQPESSTCNNTQPVLTSGSHLATTMLNPMSSTSTALSTFLAGLEARNQPIQHFQLSGLPLSTVASPLSCSYPNSTSAHTKDSLAPSCPKLRIPLQISGLPISEHGLLSVEQSVYPVANNTMNSILSVVKSDPDMYTPNGHTYSSLVDEANRFRSYPTYTQELSHHISHNTTAGRQSALTASTASNSSFFQQESLNSLLVNQTCSIQQSSVTSTNTNSHSSDESLTNEHFPSALSHSNASGNATAFTASLTPNSSDKTPQLPSSSSSSKSNTSIDDCRRNSVTGTMLNNTPNNRSEQVKVSTTYLEHLNPESKDIRRRVSHNEVERRRRDRINTWISELYKLLPPDEQTKSQYQSKGIVLKRVCEYFQNVDSMLKAANSAVEQIRVENSILRQRVHELQQENQLLSASLQLGAAAAAAHLKNRQPRPGSVNSTITNEGGTSATSGGNNESNCSLLKDSTEFTDYQSPLTVFTVDTVNYNHANNFNQTNSNCVTPTSSLNPACFATTPLASINSLGGFNVSESVASSPSLSTNNNNNNNNSNNNTSSAPEMVNQVLCPLTLPSLDHMTA